MMNRSYPFYTDARGVVRRYPRCPGAHGLPCVYNAGHDGWHWTVMEWDGSPFYTATRFTAQWIFGPRVDRRNKS